MNHNDDGGGGGLNKQGKRTRSRASAHYAANLRIVDVVLAIWSLSIIW
jgi:uncharacterized membrane protein